MTVNKTMKAEEHSTAWVVQTWMAFILAVGAMGVGIVRLPMDGWMKGYMGMGLVFTVSSTFSLSKTIRDQHESQKLNSRVDAARLERILAEHDPLK